jgi:hypothetical protein
MKQNSSGPNAGENIAPPFLRKPKRVILVPIRCAVGWFWRVCGSWRRQACGINSSLSPRIVGIGGILREYDDPGCGLFSSVFEIAEVLAKNRQNDSL